MTALPATGAPHGGHALPADIPDMAGQGVRNRFAQFGVNYRWMLLGAMLTGSLSTMLAATTVNVALPAIIGA